MHAYSEKNCSTEDICSESNLLNQASFLHAWGGSCSLKVDGNVRSAFRRFGIDKENLKRF